jgi:hypothetical protein
MVTWNEPATPGSWPVWRRATWGLCPYALIIAWGESMAQDDLDVVRRLSFAVILRAVQDVQGIGPKLNNADQAEARAWLAGDGAMIAAAFNLHLDLARLDGARLKYIRFLWRAE